MRVSVLAPLLLSLVAGTASAADTARARLDAFSKGLTSVSASFEQQISDIHSGKTKISRGTLSLKAPRQFRWDTTTPYKQLIVADGEKVWIYDPDLEQVTVRAQGTEEAHSPLTVLTDLSQLDRDFTTSEQGEHDGQVWLRLKSKDKEPQFEYADLGFDQTGLASMAFKDTFDNSTQIRFSGWQRNAKLAPDLFKFTPPKGVDVVGDATPAAETHPLKP
ncbi:outer membrane lipoprotein chaperone LolA [Rudaea cellulosilytica]|uniref:outer membrane lipoprotein chaperone LolA n=1 Tax=Rudaea cellulosilytica TaxID=540746 RepID=UPI000379ABA4|nr:outer membrane lipoprotein chaperone LolA [Rudaea cellulosilytica]